MDDFAKLFLLPVNQCKVSSSYRWFSLDIGRLTHRKTITKDDSSEDVFIFGEFRIFIQSDWQILKKSNIIGTRYDEDFEVLAKTAQIFMGSTVKQVRMSDNLLEILFSFSNGYQLQVTNSLGPDSPWKFFTIT